MKKSLILSLLAVAVCSFAVYAGTTDLSNKIVTKTEKTSSTIQTKTDTANNIVAVTGNEKIKNKTSKVSTDVKDKTKKTETKIT
ncbi:MAG: hypothetical protein PHY39_07420, partial [Endomicrobiaceae bacterium]|nr:hypothetical protein [Endomicrobiaceae bacterium]